MIYCKPINFHKQFIFLTFHKEGNFTKLKCSESVLYHLIFTETRKNLKQFIVIKLMCTVLAFQHPFEILPRMFGKFCLECLVSSA